MKKLILSLFLLGPLAALAQGPFTIKGTGTGFKNGDKIYLAYRVNDQLNVDSAVVSQGTFAFQGSIKDITSAWMYQNEKPMQMETSYNSIGFYIEPGNILFTTADAVKHAKISGTKTNMDLTTIRKELKTLQNKCNKLDGDFEALKPEDQVDSIKVANFRKKVQMLYAEMEPVKFGFVNAHPDSYMSLVIVYDLIRKAAPIAQIALAYATLTPDLKSSPLGEETATAIAGRTSEITGETKLAGKAGRL